MLKWNFFGSKKNKSSEEICLNESGDFYLNSMENLDLESRSKNFDYYYPLSLEPCENLKPQKNLNIVIYNINKSLSQPFIEFLLFKNSMYFNFILMNFNGEFEDLIKELNKYLNLHIKSSFTIENKGFVNYSNNDYLVCELDLNNENLIIESDQKFDFATIHDIINVHFIYDVFINENVENFLKNNKSFLFLYKNVSNLKEFIPNPIVMYGLSHKNDEKYHLKRGREKENGQFGDGYYFNNFNFIYPKRTSEMKIFKYLIQPNNIKYIFNRDAYKLYKDNWRDMWDTVLINIDNQQLVINDKKNHIVKGSFIEK